MTAKHQRKVLNGPKQRIDIVCIVDVAKESVLTTTTARETFGASKSSKISYFHTKYLLYWMVYQVKIAMFFYLACKIERFSLDCRKGSVLVLVLLRPLVGYCIYFGFGFTTVK